MRTTIGSTSWTPRRASGSDRRSAPATSPRAALHRDLVVVATNGGRLVGLDAATGAQRWALQLAGPTWSSPVVVDDVLLEGDCDGVLHAFDVADTTVAPGELWSVQLGGCESTPAVWDGTIYVGTRAGAMVALR